MPARATINLLPKSEFDSSFWGRLLRWALTSGRYIIILTEVVVILAFLSRFKLDADLADLADRIEGKRKVLEALSESENGFRQVQTRLDAVGKLAKSQVDMTDIYTRLDTAMPEGSEIFISSVEVTDENVILSGQTASEKSLGRLLSNLSADANWKSIELLDISTDIQKKTVFSVSLKL